MSEIISATVVEVRPMLLGDIAQVAELHSTIFPDYFLTHLGVACLDRFYLAFIDQAGAYAQVASFNQKIVGFVVGVSDSSSLFGRFYQHNFLFLALTVGRRIFLDTQLRQAIFQRLPHINYAVRSLFYKVVGKSSVGRMKSPSQVSARLLSIGILSEYRGKGIADKLTHHFFKQLQEDGISIVGLSVQTGNVRAISFYEKTGWSREEVTEAGIYFSRSTHID